LTLDTRFNADDLEIGQLFVGKHPRDGLTQIDFELVRLTAKPVDVGRRCKGTKLVMLLRHHGNAMHEVTIPTSLVKQGQFWSHKFLPKHIACRPKPLKDGAVSTGRSVADGPAL
jgi:hypothetical protein